jgi:predicted ester cyclase
MAETAHEALLQRYIETVWDQGNTAALDDFLAPDYRRHRSPSAAPLDRNGQKMLLNLFRDAFPDIRIEVVDVISDSDKIAFRSMMQGTHTGEFFGIAPTGKSVKFNLMDIIRIENGKFAEQWGGPDMYDLLRQLDAVQPLK